MVQSVHRQNGSRRKRKAGESTPAGRRSQIQFKLNHGIRGLSPVLLGVEREKDWREHFDGVCRSLVPGNEFETDLVFLIAWQLWRFGRLIRHETALTNEKIHKPPESIFDPGNNPTVTKEAILGAIARLECERQNGSNGSSRNGASKASDNSLLSRCLAIESGTPEVVFDHVEVRQILELVLARVRSRAEEETDEDADDEDDAVIGEDDQALELTVAERPWVAREIAEQIQILSSAAGLDWREELSVAIQSLQEVEKEAADERARQMEEARQHVLHGLVLGERTVARLSLYERQICSQFKSTYSLLERARAWRLGMPVPAPVSVDVTVSKGCDANGV